MEQHLPENTKVCQTFLLRALHHFIRAVLRSLANVTLAGLSTSTKYDTRDRIPLTLASYVCQMPEGEYLVYDTCGIFTASYCWTFLLSRHELSDCKCGQPKLFLETADLLRYLFLNEEGVGDLIKDRSLIFIFLILLEFPMIDRHSRVEFCSIFWSHPMYTCLAKISLSLKECLRFILKAGMQTT